MKRTATIFLSVLALSAAALAQDQAAIDKALLAAPGNTKANAGVIKWKSDGTYETLKKGTSTLVCYDKSGQPNMPPFIVECTNMGNLPRAAQNMKIEAMGDKAEGASRIRGRRERRYPREARVRVRLVSLHGPRPGTRPHPYDHRRPRRDAASLGLPDNNKSGGVWIMNAGTSTAHLMTPGE